MVKHKDYLRFFLTNHIKYDTIRYSEKQQGNIMMSYLEGVRLDYETASLITRLTLIDSLKAINIDIAALEKKESLQDYMKEDLEYDLKYREALLVVIGNFSTKDEMTKVLKECNAATNDA
jgi:hypothetical protein|tara:strand:+ start:642 stop:1001 length:360 start_codon:yes stop_codon:yes gene_type:complete